MALRKLCTDQDEALKGELTIEFICSVCGHWDI